MGEEIYVPAADGRPLWRLYLKDLGLPDGGGIIEVQLLADVTAEEESADEVVDTAPPQR